ncbi:histidine phosphatase family protein (plasmid) [Paenibacillus polymyxa]|uniref:histidine phosphatase family protein n=1 Tax=Paenibacillus polymyxa TaxID=1406 RepID=UPI003B5C8EE7
MNRTSYEIKFILAANRIITENQELQLDLPGLRIAEHTMLDIRFLDTLQLGLYVNGWILRSRVKASKDKTELTYKKRLPLSDNLSLEAALREAEAQGFDLNNPDCKIEVEWGLQNRTLSLSYETYEKAPEAQQLEAWRALFKDHAPKELDEFSGDLDQSSLLGPVKAKKSKGAWSGMDISIEIWAIGAETIAEISMKSENEAEANAKHGHLKQLLQDAQVLSDRDVSKTKWALDKLAKAVADTDMLKQLRQGGFGLYFRHAQPSDISIPDPDLSLLGREQAGKLGEWLRLQDIPIQYPVSASPMKRTHQTAELIFGKENVATDRQLAQMDKPDLLAAVPAAGINHAFVAHYNSFNGKVSPSQLNHLGLVVLQPKGAGNSFDVVHIMEPLSIQQAAKLT